MDLFALGTSLPTKPTSPVALNCGPPPQARMPSQRTETAPTGACPSTNDFMGPRAPARRTPVLRPCRTNLSIQHPPPAPPGEPQTPHQAHHHHHHHHLDDDPPVCRPRSIVVFRFVGRSFVAGRRRNCWMHAAAAAAAPFVPPAASLFSRRSSDSARAMRSFTRTTNWHRHWRWSAPIA